MLLLDLWNACHHGYITMTSIMTSPPPPSLPTPFIFNCLYCSDSFAAVYARRRISAAESRQQWGHGSDVPHSHPCWENENRLCAYVPHLLNYAVLIFTNSFCSCLLSIYGHSNVLIYSHATSNGIYVMSLWLTPLNSAQLNFIQLKNYSILFSGIVLSLSMLAFWSGKSSQAILPEQSNSNRPYGPS